MKSLIYLSVPTIAIGSYFYRDYINCLIYKLLGLKEKAAPDWVVKEINMLKQLKGRERKLASDVESLCKSNYDFIVQLQKKHISKPNSQIANIVSIIVGMRFLRLFSNVYLYALGRKSVIAPINNDDIFKAISNISASYMDYLIGAIAKTVDEAASEYSSLFHSDYPEFLMAVIDIVDVQLLTYEPIQNAQNNPAPQKAIKLLHQMQQIAQNNKIQDPLKQQTVDEIIDYCLTSYFQSLLLQGIREDVNYVAMVAKKQVKPCFPYNQSVVLVQYLNNTIAQLSMKYFNEEVPMSGIEMLLGLSSMAGASAALPKRVEYLKNLKCFVHYIYYHDLHFTEEVNDKQEFDNLLGLVTKLMI